MASQTYIPVLFFQKNKSVKGWRHRCQCGNKGGTFLPFDQITPLLANAQDVRLSIIRKNKLSRQAICPPISFFLRANAGNHMLLCSVCIHGHPQLAMKKTIDLATKAKDILRCCRALGWGTFWPVIGRGRVTHRAGGGQSKALSSSLNHALLQNYLLSFLLCPWFTFASYGEKQGEGKAYWMQVGCREKIGTLVLLLASSQRDNVLC